MRSFQRMLMGVMTLACVASVGCLPYASTMAAKTAFGTENAEVQVSPFSTTVRTSSMPYSDWESCMHRLRGFDGAKARCDAEMARWSPWQPAQWGQGYGHGYPPSVYAGGLPGTYPGTQIPYGP